MSIEDYTPERIGQLVWSAAANAASGAVTYTVRLAGKTVWVTVDVGEAAEAKRYQVRRWTYQGTAGWGVFDTARQDFTGGWFGAEVRQAAEAMCAMHNGEEPDWSWLPTHLRPGPAPEQE